MIDFATTDHAFRGHVPPPYPHPNAAAGFPRPAAPPASSWIAQMLDEIDYGMLLLDADGRLLHANATARCELNGEHPLQLVDSALQARHPADKAPLREAVRAATQLGRQRLLSVGRGNARLAVAVLPLEALPDGRRAAVVMLGKREVCELLSVQWFARCHELTAAEEDVLHALCAGRGPLAIARERRVKIATVRTQIHAVRAKTGAASIRELVRMVAKLPPMMGALRSAPARIGERPSGMPAIGSSHADLHAR